MSKSTTVNSINIENTIFDIQENGYFVFLVLHISTSTLGDSVDLYNKFYINGHDLGGFVFICTGADRYDMIGTHYVYSYINGISCFVSDLERKEPVLPYLLPFDGSFNKRYPTKSSNESLYIPFPVYFDNLKFTNIMKKEQINLKLEYKIYYYTEVK